MKSLTRELYFNQNIYNSKLWNMRYSRKYKPISNKLLWDVEPFRQILTVISTVSHKANISSYK